MPETSYLRVDDYVEALRELGGEATSNEIADKLDKHYYTVNRMLDPDKDKTPDCVRRQIVGGTYLYRINESDGAQDGEAARDDDEKEGETA